MEFRKLDKRGQINQVPGFFQIMLLVVIFAGLTFIVLDKFIDTSYETTSASIVNESTTPTDVGVNLAKYTLRDVSCGAITKIYNASNFTIGMGTPLNFTQTNCLLQNKTSYYGTKWLVSYPYTYEDDTMASNAVNSTSNDLYDYGIGFLGIIILVVMVYLIISIVSGRRSGAK